MGGITERYGAPGWVITMLAGMLITLLSFTITASTRAQEMKSDIKMNAIHIETKANTEHVDALEKESDRSYEILLRIEKKLDDHIKNVDQ